MDVVVIAISVMKSLNELGVKKNCELRLGKEEMFDGLILSAIERLHGHLVYPAGFFSSESNIHQVV